MPSFVGPFLVAAIVATTTLAIALQVQDLSVSFARDLTSSTWALQNVRVQIVVARYAEDVSWLANLPFDNVVVYDKNDRKDTRDFPAPSNAKVVKLPNVGRCDHTYLYHIVSNWDSLADVTVFVPGSCANLDAKWRKLEWVIDRVRRTGDSAFPIDSVIRRPLHEAYHHFVMESYAASTSVNATANPEMELQLCKHRPYGEFFRHNFPETPIVHEIMFKGVFAVSRAHIHQNPRSRYEKLLSYLDHHSNPEAGHFIERSWLAVFYPIPNECLSVATCWHTDSFDTWFLIVSITLLMSVTMF